MFEMTSDTIFSSKPFNIIFNNLIWIACVIGREDYVWIVAPVVIAYISILIRSNPARLDQIFAPALLGISIDSFLTFVGVFQFSSPSLFLPLWMMVLWLSFSTSLTNSLQFLGKKKFITSVVGCIAIPANYLAGERLGAVTFAHDYLLTTIILCSLWAIGLPLLYFLTRFQYNKVRELAEY